MPSHNFQLWVTHSIPYTHTKALQVRIDISFGYILVAQHRSKVHKEATFVLLNTYKYTSTPKYICSVGTNYTLLKI